MATIGLEAVSVDPAKGRYIRDFRSERGRQVTTNAQRSPQTAVRLGCDIEKATQPAVIRNAIRVSGMPYLHRPEVGTIWVGIANPFYDR